jgi:hypothetical protein
MRFFGAGEMKACGSQIVHNCAFCFDFFVSAPLPGIYFSSLVEELCSKITLTELRNESNTKDVQIQVGDFLSLLKVKYRGLIPFTIYLKLRLLSLGL